MATPLNRRTLLSSLLSAGALTSVASMRGVNAQSFAPEIGLAATRLKSLNKGFNLPGWVNVLEAAPPSEQLLKTLHQHGFNGIRLPIDPAMIMGVSGRAVLERIVAVVRQLNALGYAVTWDMHLEQNLIDLFATDVRLASDVVADAWALLAPVLADMSPEKNVAELLNEPPLNTSDWVMLRDRLAGIIRQHCPDHTLIWGAAPYQGIYDIMQHPLLPDANAIAAIHYYFPLGFTHQCADWDQSPLSQIHNLPFPASKEAIAVTELRNQLVLSGNQAAVDYLDQEFSSPWTYEHIEADFTKIGQWSQRHDCPVILNEFGVLNFCVDAQSRANWIAQVRSAATRAGLAWNYWEFDQGFGFVGDRNDPSSLDLPLMSALLGA